ncbi:MAG TPA: glycosyltransferase [Roseateles sp.]
MPQPSFSVIVANYNHADLVGRAVESVLAQDYPAALREVIVVDDGSTDDSREVLQAWAGREGVQLVFQQNRGQTAAFAAGLAAARGDYVCLLDADDRCHPYKLAAIAHHLATLDSDPERLFLCHDLDILDGADGPAIASGWFEVIGQQHLGSHLHLNAAHHFFPFAVTSGMVYGRALLQRAMAEVPTWEWPMGSDAILGHTAMILCGEVHYLPRRLGSYVVHGGNNLASIENGRFRAKPIWHDRWPRKLRFLELLVDAQPFSEHERAERLGYLGRLAHVVRADPAGRRYPQPLLSFVVDAQDAPPAWSLATAEAIAAQRDGHCEAVWVGDAATLAALPAACAGARAEAADDAYARLRAGFTAARGGYLCFLGAGDRPDPLFTAKHVNAHRFGTLPMLTASDLRLIDADGVLVHHGLLMTAAGWSGGSIKAFAHTLREWPLPPLPALVLRRTSLLAAFFAADSLALPSRATGWLLAHYLLQMGGASRLAENLLDLRLPREATPNASWLSQFTDRHGPLPALDLAAAAEALFAAYGRARADERMFFSDGWETRFLRWLLQSGGGDTAARLERVARKAQDAAWGQRMLAQLRALLAPRP